MCLARCPGPGSVSAIRFRENMRKPSGAATMRSGSARKVASPKAIASVLRPIGLFGDRRVVTFILSAGCRKVSETLPFADMGWYLNALIPALIPLGLGGVVSTDGYLD